MPSKPKTDLFSTLADPQPIQYVYAQTAEQYNTFWESDLGRSWLDPRIPWGIDIETNALSPAQGQIITIQIATTADFALIIDWRTIDRDAVRAHLNGQFEKRTKIAHNITFEIEWLTTNGFIVEGRLFDTMLADQLLTCGHSLSYGLKELCKRRLHIDLSKAAQTSFVLTRSISEFQLQYAGLDACVLIPLYTQLRRELKNEKLVEVAKIEFDATIPVAEMERFGILCDWDYLSTELTPKLSDRVSEARTAFIDTLRKAPKDLFGNPVGVNLQSPAQAKGLLEAELGVSLESVSRDYLGLLDDPTGVVTAYLAATADTKNLQTARDFEKYRNPSTGRVHTWFKQLFARTGRFSSANPNLQNIPRGKDFRRAIIARDGYSLVVADYSQIELRIAAEIANEDSLRQAYIDGRDVHTLMASILADVPESEVTKVQRSSAKAVNFGFLYGMGWRKFKNYARTSYGVDVSEYEAKSFRSKFFSAWPGFAEWHKTFDPKVMRENIDRSFTRSGRRRYLDLQERKLTTYANNPVQGTGADIVKLALFKVWSALRHLDATLVLQVHDEIVLEVRDDHAQESADILSTQMRLAGEHFLKTVPIEVDADIGKNWAYAKN